MNPTLTVPELALVVLVVLVGASGSGKSTFAHRHFKPTEVLSSDFFRALVADDETDQSVSTPAFELLHLTAAKRLELGRLTVIDATNVQAEARKPLLELARRYHVLPVAIVFDLPEAICQERNRSRPNRNFGAHVVRNYVHQLRRSLPRLRDEGFRAVHVLETVEEIDAAKVVREPLRVNRKYEHGPFDIIGDVHGCLDELKELLTKLGYVVGPEGVTPPAGRKAVFVGDLVDRGPDTPGVLDLVMNLVAAGHALCVRGNHDDKLPRKLRDRDVSITHGLEQSLQQLEGRPPEFIEKVRAFLDGLPTHYVFDGGKLVVAHAGLKANLQGRVSDRVRAFALYGETTGESDEFGLPVRLNWAAEYRGKATVVYGHTPTLNPEWVNRTVCIDTGCVFGGALTALRYPEQELVGVPAAKTYAEPKRPLRVSLSEGTAGGAAQETGQQLADDVLDIADVIGKRIIPTRFVANIQIREENAAAALEVMSRFAVNPRWLIYLPPTMSPCATSAKPNLLEHPREAFDYFAREGVQKVVCEQKHMGSRAIMVVCRDEDAARRRFGVAGEGAGVCYTRTGRRFFDDAALEAAFLGRLRAAIDTAGFWEHFATDWFCLDGELMPWSAKAQELLRRQYAATGSAGRFALAAALNTTPSGRPDLAELRRHFEGRAEAVTKYVEAYRRYCWTVRSVDDLKFAPFHLLATEGKVHIDQDHAWHMTMLRYLAKVDELVMATPFQLVDQNDPSSIDKATKWWTELTEAGGEGMVVKPLAWVNRGKRGLVQPAVKVRGREYLRIIYGPEYTRPEHLDRLRARGLGLKQSLAVREFSLGIEALERFVAREPLRRVHECCFGVLALESEPVDPRL
jgi:protein phosphatase